METTEIIRETTNTVETLSGLGADGFILFAILIVALLFVFMGYVTYKSQKTMIETLTTKHNDNAEAIEHAHDRIHEMEVRENECIRRLDTATTKLESCTSRLEGCFEKMREV